MAATQPLPRYISASSTYRQRECRLSAHVYADPPPTQQSGAAQVSHQGDRCQLACKRVSCLAAMPSDAQAPSFCQSRFICLTASQQPVHCHSMPQSACCMRVLCMLLRHLGAWPAIHLRIVLRVKQLSFEASAVYALSFHVKARRLLHSIGRTFCYSMLQFCLL